MVKEHLRGILFLAVAGYAAWTFYGRGDAPSASSAGTETLTISGPDRRSSERALKLHYRDHDIYFPVNCDAKDGGEPERTWIRCHPVPDSGVSGGLFTADIRDGVLHI